MNSLPSFNHSRDRPRPDGARDRAQPRCRRPAGRRVGHRCGIAATGRSVVRRSARGAGRPGRNRRYRFLVVPSSREIEAILHRIRTACSPARARAVRAGRPDFTSYPADTRRLAAMAAEAGRAYLDCGMSGGATSADQGRLTTDGRRRQHRAGARPRPALDIIAARVLHVGGSTLRPSLMKLVHNMVSLLASTSWRSAGRLAPAGGARRPRPRHRDRGDQRRQSLPAATSARRGFPRTTCCPAVLTAARASPTWPRISAWRPRSGANCNLPRCSRR